LQTGLDKDHQTINISLFYFGKAVSQLAISDVDFKETLAMEVDLAGNHQLSLIDFLSKHKTFYSKLEAELENVIISYPSGVIPPQDGELIKHLCKLLVYKEYVYEPAIYTVLEEAELDGELVFAVGEQIDEDDNIFGWEGTTPVVVSEQAAKTTYRNMLIVGLGNGEYKGIQDKYEKNKRADIYSEPNDLNGAIEQRNGTALRVKQYQIKNGYRYESSGKSELEMVLLSTFLNSSDYDVSDSFIRTYKVRKRAIDDSRSYDNRNDDFGSYISQKFSSSSNADFVFVPFEHDWYASLKTNTCNCSCDNDSFYIFETRMTFSHEWYAIECDPLSNVFPNTGSSLSTNNVKSSFRIARGH
jgi:hypothetical protein